MLYVSVVIGSNYIPVLLIISVFVLNGYVAADKYLIIIELCIVLYVNALRLGQRLFRSVLCRKGRIFTNESVV